MSQISRKFDFQPGTKIKSADVDDEFNQLIAGHNDHDTSIGTLNSQMTSANTQITASNTKADNAVSTANAANIAATDAQTKANSAVTTSNSALSIAQAAMTEADQAATTATTVQTNYEALRPQMEDAVASVEGKADKAYVDSVASSFQMGTVLDNSLTEAKMAADMKKQAGGVAKFDDLTALQNEMTTVKTKIVPHLGTTTNVGNAYTVTTSETIESNDKFSVTFNVAATGAATLNTISLVKPGGLSHLPKAGTYTYFYNGSNFQLLGEEGVISKLPNLVKNGNFENGLSPWYTPSPDAILGIDTTYKKYGLNGADLYVPAALNEGFLMQDNIKYTQGHKYYVCYWALSSVAGKPSAVYFPATGTYPVSPPIECTNPYTWYFNSFISQDSSIASGNYSIRIDNDNNNVGMSMVFDGVMIIDLTESCGAGKEPSKADMDYAISLFGGWWDSDLEALTVDGTITAADITLNKVGYSNGQRFVGTNTNVGWAFRTGTTSGSPGGTTVVDLGFEPSFVYMQVQEATYNGLKEMFLYDAASRLFHIGYNTGINSTYTKGGPAGSTYLMNHWDIPAVQVTPTASGFTVISQLAGCAYFCWAFA
ncbi:MAG: hypothetical protein HF312_17075 [Ignavibacteria bacterium]|jgi:hypothetical protein|nr:hypothetical protein [Ignavibacteria bacterium]